ncbi:hypothetical protein CHL78_008080 [Romboutsia weinsteinii]|uniref:ABC transporter permease n=1 Tax=Romboutsia weinsteinii TaxID=2020949 RepID=A0A371J4G6_9FIRM|nr:ABC transporter permease subunit [Romboutsia weinsteinii]RDY27672.1 hypothetical protein CHL78_008080 [Romboutsia weinsteinii]
MYNLLKAEIYKLKYSKELLICLVGLFVLSAINIYYGNIEGAKSTLASQSREMFGLMACTLFAVTYVGKDSLTKTISYTLTSGQSRGRVILSKYCCFLIASTIILIMNYILMGGLYSIFYGWGQLFNSEELYFLIAYIMLGIYFDLCIVSIPFFICILVNTSSLAMALSCGFIGLILSLSQMPWDTVAYSIASKDTSLGILPIIFIIGFLLVTIILYLACSYCFNNKDI